MESYFHSGVSLTGTLRIKGVMHFEGDFQGEIYSDDHFIVGKLGNIRGKLNVRDFTNMGTVKGNVRAEGKISLISESDLIGDITTNQLVVEEGVVFEGRCKMINRKGPSKKRKSQKDIPAAAQEEQETQIPGELAAETDPVPQASEAPYKKTGPKLKAAMGKKLAAAMAFIFVIGAGYYYYPGILSSELDANIARGYEYIERKKYSAAESEFQKALINSRNNPKVYAGLGEVYLKKKKFGEALAHFQRSLELEPSESSYHLKLAEAYTGKGQFGEAMKVYKTVLELDPESYQAYYQIGVLRIHEGARADAVESLNLAVKLNPDFYQPHKVLGELYAREGKSKQSLAEISEAIRLKDDDPDLYLILGELLMEEKKETEAIAAFRKVTQLFPQNFQAQVRLANWYFQRGEADQSLEFYTRAESIEPGNHEVQTRLGKLYSDKNEYPKAMRAFRKAVELNPQDDGSFYHLGRLLAMKGKHDEARQALESAVSLNNKSGDAHLELGKVLLALGEGKEAVNEMKRNQALNPGSNSSYYLAKALTVQKKYDSAARALLNAAKKDPTNHLLQFGLCETYISKQFFTAAIGHCEKALELESGYADTLSLLAGLYARKNKKLDKALEYARRSLEKDPGNSDYLRVLADVYSALGEESLAEETLQSAIEGTGG